MVPIKVSRGGLEGIGNRYTGIRISSLLAFFLLVTLPFDSYIRIRTLFSEERRKREKERERKNDRGRRDERGGGERDEGRRRRDRGDGGGEEVAEDEGRKDKERTKERRLALMHHRGNGMVWGRGPSYLSYFRPP